MPEPQRPLLSAMATLLLCVAGGLAVGGSFGVLDQQFEQAGNQTLTLSYTAWKITQGGTYPSPIQFFRAPHFGYPLVTTGAVAVAGGLLLVLGRGAFAWAAGAIAATGAGMLAGTVWTIAMAVSADLDTVDRTDSFQLKWTSGIGFWLVLGGGVAAAIGGVLALLATFGRPPAKVTPSPHPRTDRDSAPES